VVFQTTKKKEGKEDKKAAKQLQIRSDRKNRGECKEKIITNRMSSYKH
jgi:hypothetical protein